MKSANQSVPPMLSPGVADGSMKSIDFTLNAQISQISGTIANEATHPTNKNQFNNNCEWIKRNGKINKHYVDAVKAWNEAMERINEEIRHNNSKWVKVRNGWYDEETDSDDGWSDNDGWGDNDGWE